MHPLLGLARSRAVNRISLFAAESGRLLQSEELVGLYRSLLAEAPRRRSVGKSYFVGHTGIPASGGWSNRYEEHLAIALFNHHNEGRLLELASGRLLQILDYQFPLKARRADEGVGKIDLLAAIDRNAIGIIELKHQSAERSSLAETPLRALLEVLAYGAIVEANLADITMEIPITRLERPTRVELLVVANAAYWQAWQDRVSAGRWQDPLARLSLNLIAALGIPIRYLTLDPVEFEMGLEGRKPALRTRPVLSPVPGLPS